MGYHLEGRLLEVCDCRVLCPCWIGEDPDNGTCDSVLAYRFDAGTIEGVDVTGRTLAMVSHIPGDVRFSIAAGVKGDLLTSRAFLHFIDLRGLMSPHGALASLRGWRAATS
jgi:hypothetical protein